ncbi:MAG: hypothetical protein ACRDRB_08930 [Pseudonocardiaceae bacterium]
MDTARHSGISRSTPHERVLLDPQCTPAGPVPGRAATVHQPEAHDIPLIGRLR